jgi:hypothetical protein
MRMRPGDYLSRRAGSRSIAISASRIAITANNSAKRHESEKHQHSAIAFEAACFEKFDPGKPGADAKRSATQRAQHQTQQDKQRDFHGRDSLTR